MVMKDADGTESPCLEDTKKVLLWFLFPCGAWVAVERCQVAAHPSSPILTHTSVSMQIRAWLVEHGLLLPSAGPSQSSHICGDDEDGDGGEDDGEGEGVDDGVDDGVGEGEGDDEGDDEGEGDDSMLGLVSALRNSVLRAAGTHKRMLHEVAEERRVLALRADTAEAARDALDKLLGAANARVESQQQQLQEQEHQLQERARVVKVGVATPGSHCESNPVFFVPHEHI